MIDYLKQAQEEVVLATSKLMDTDNAGDMIRLRNKVMKEPTPREILIAEHKASAVAVSIDNAKTVSAVIKRADINTDLEDHLFARQAIADYQAFTDLAEGFNGYKGERLLLERDRLARLSLNELNGRGFKVDEADLDIDYDRQTDAFDRRYLSLREDLTRLDLTGTEREQAQTIIDAHINDAYDRSLSPEAREVTKQLRDTDSLSDLNVAIERGVSNATSGSELTAWKQAQIAMKSVDEHLQQQRAENGTNNINEGRLRESAKSRYEMMYQMIQGADRNKLADTELMSRNAAEDRAINNDLRGITKFEKSDAIYNDIQRKNNLDLSPESKAVLREIEITGRIPGSESFELASTGRFDNDLDGTKARWDAWQNAEQRIVSRAISEGVDSQRGQELIGEYVHAYRNMMTDSLMRSSTLSDNEKERNRYRTEAVMQAQAAKKFEMVNDNSSVKTLKR